MRPRRRPSTLKGAIAGLLGGLIASWAMNQFQAFLSRKNSGGERNSNNSDEFKDLSSEQSQSLQQDSDDATMRAADLVWTKATGSPLSKQEKKTAGPIVHYLFGSSMGAFYGATAEHFSWASLGKGVLFGTFLFVGADEVAVPAFGLSQSPQKYPLSSHASALAAHLVYGVTTELIRSLSRTLLQ